MRIHVTEAGLTQSAQKAVATEIFGGPASQVMLEGPNKPKWPANDFKGTEGCFGRDGFLGCFTNIKICACSCCCPCWMISDNMARLGQSQSVWTGAWCCSAYFCFEWIVGLEARRRIQLHLGKPLTVSDTDDTKNCCAVCCCPHFALAQEARILGAYSVTGEKVGCCA